MAIDGTAGGNTLVQGTGSYADGYNTYITGLSGQSLLAHAGLCHGPPTRSFTAASTFHRTAENLPLVELAQANSAGTMPGRTTLYADAMPHRVWTRPITR